MKTLTAIIASFLIVGISLVGLYVLILLRFNYPMPTMIISSITLIVMIYYYLRK